ncbi:MAG: polyphosphate kinase 1 [Candidatus Riflebacteria bacterium]|nr:polyphosphate kinase 1 [Candidatus Riflebacteria bacterium]
MTAKQRTEAAKSVPSKSRTGNGKTLVKKMLPEKAGEVRAVIADSFLNRELSWLEFNLRVLHEAQDSSKPLLERLKFLAITGSNLDEFFMVRVGGLRRIQAAGGSGVDPSGLSVAEQLSEIGRRTRRLVVDQYNCLLRDLEPALEKAGMRRQTVETLSPEQYTHIERNFENELFPVITPMAVVSFENFPLLPGLGLNLAVRLKGVSRKPRRGPSTSVSTAACPPGPGGPGALSNALKDVPPLVSAVGENAVGETQFRYAIVPLPRGLPRFVTVPGGDGYCYILLEDVVTAFIQRLFPGEPVLETVSFRITRNADLAVAEDQASDFMEEMKDVLVERKRGDCVRLEIDRRASRQTLAFLSEALEIGAEEIYTIAGPIQLSSFMTLGGKPGFDGLRFEPWPPLPSPDLKPGDSMFEAIARHDIFLAHPYQSFEPVTRFIDEAADDPDVLAIKQILYRTSKESPIVAALARAAAKEKHVTVLVELKARFDEARNIEWASALERAGVQVIYGLRGLKVHGKICIVVRREAGGIKRYVHFGTGNYNETTARIYSDVSLMTCAEDFGADASAFFNAITGYSQPVRYRKIEAAPVGLRSRLIDLIDSETERSRQGQVSFIKAKLNSLVDVDVIKALYRASMTGVKIDLIVRGICCLRPGVKGLSENIRVISIVDRFLEHARLLYFHHGGDRLLFLSSADWMPRNLDRRVELLVPVEYEPCRAVMMEILESAFFDTAQAWQLQTDGNYLRINPVRGAKMLRSQEILYKKAKDAFGMARKNRVGVFEPQRPTVVRS